MWLQDSLGNKMDVFYSKITYDTTIYCREHDQNMRDTPLFIQENIKKRFSTTYSRKHEQKMRDTHYLNPANNSKSH